MSRCADRRASVKFYANLCAETTLIAKSTEADLKGEHEIHQNNGVHMFENKAVALCIWRCHEAYDPTSFSLVARTRG